jgi:(1->4)-alpha-D-glucan 1-alpha-D-glucosylmutase
MDVLENGPASQYAHFFDIDFDSPIARLKGKTLAPFLGDNYEETLLSGDLKVVRDETTDKVAVAYHHHRFPIRPADRDTVSSNISRYRDPQILHALLEQQNFVLAWWRTASDQINWRRFFDITELAALRVELPDVFEAVHRKIFDLYQDNMIDGVRVDHVDGLRDPAGYCQSLRARLEDLARKRPSRERPYIVVEKILGPGEMLPAGWGVDGTTGYDFMNQVSALQHDPAGEHSLTEFWMELSGRAPDFEAEELTAREEMLRTGFDHQLATTAGAFYEVAQNVGTRDLTEQAIHRALVHIIRHMRIYRTYATGRQDSPPPGKGFDAAVSAAREEAPAETLAIDFVAAIMANAEADKAVSKFNHLTAPIAAKAVEDTAFYRYGRLLSRTDVGFEPGRLAIAPAEFHDLTQRRASTHPGAMSATATHDHKRGEDVRARLAVLSEMAEEWRDEAGRWFRMNDAIRPSGIAADDEYQLYQTLVGMWPLEGVDLASLRERVSGWRVKSLREAKLRSSWAQPDIDYEAANITFIEAAFDLSRSAPFLRSLEDFVRKIARAGALNGLVQLALRMTLPGVPDMFQGTEFWDLSLVDPDNRGPVDFASRLKALNIAEGAPVSPRSWRSGAVKQAVAARLLRLRAQEPELFSRGDYCPLAIEGSRRNNAIAFARSYGGVELVVAAAIRCAEALAESDSVAPPVDWWQDTNLVLPNSVGPSTDILSGNGPAPTKTALEQMGALPVLVLLFR